MSPSLNNLFVESLRQGHAHTIDALASLGMVGLSTPLDLVSHAPVDLLGKDTEPAVTTHSLWFWVHQAPLPDAARRCWETWVSRELSGLAPDEGRARLQGLFSEAVSAAMGSGNSAPLVESWHQAVDAASRLALDWSSAAASQAVAQAMGDHGDDAAPVLSDLFMAGLVVPRAARRWAGDPQGPWDLAARRGYPGLLDALAFVAETVPRSAFERLAGRVSTEIETLVLQGPSAWMHAGVGERLVRCRAIVERLGGARPLPLAGGLAQALEGVGKRPEGWPEHVLGQFASWRLDAALPAPAKPSRRGRL